MKFKIWMLILPCTVLILVNGILPGITVFNYSFRTIFTGRVSTYVGLDNYRRLIASPEFHNAIKNSLFILAESLAIQIPLGLAIALAIPKRGKLAAFCLVILAIPMVTPSLVGGYMWRLLCRREVGPYSTLLHNLGYDYSLVKPFDAMQTIVAIDVWQWTPLVVILLYTALVSLPSEPFEAAKIDRANDWKIFRHITLPALKFPIIIAFLLRLMDNFRIFDSVWIMTGGGPGRATEVLSIITARQALQSFAFGYAGTISLVYLLFAMVLSYALYKVFTSR